MALIGTLRNRMGTFLVVFVFAAIAVFILGDLFGNNGVLLGRNTVGEIAGHEISLEEYQNFIQEREANYLLNFGRNPGEREMTTLRQQAWELLIVKYALETQYEKVGVMVPGAEVQDMIWGKNIDEGVRQSFTNPETGQFDKDRVLSYLGELKNLPNDNPARIQWEMFERNLVPGRQRVKYENLLIKGDYVTTAEAEREYHVQSDVAEAKYLYVPFFAVSDSAIKVNDSDLKAYYSKNKEKFKTEESRDLKFVSFPIVASKTDSAEIFRELIRLAGELKISTEDSAFAVRNSDNANAFNKLNPGNLPEFLKSKNLVAGEIYGPVIENGNLVVAKVSKIDKDTIFNARASHILIKWDDESESSKKAAKEKARKILAEIKGGADFAAKAREHGTDGTATTGGDLGWFSSGRMVKKFEDAVFGASKAGLLNDVVETEFGYHIIKVDNAKTNVAYHVATVERSFSPSDASINEVLRKAEMFATDVSSVESFEAKAKAEGLQVRDAKRLTSGERNLSNLGDARQVIQWLFREGERNKISPVFDLQENYVVAVMTDEIGKGYKPFEAVKSEITPAVKNELKGKAIVEKLGKSKGNTLEEIRDAFGADANVYTSSDVRLSANTIASVGYDPAAVGLVFSLENGKRSSAFVGENGVLIVELQNKTLAPSLQDYSPYKNIIQQNNTSKNYSIAEAIKEKANIEDTRYKFY
ncbi:MAG: SurA N-terminal domain-containing protein [Cyclobacteriaceae bacterium]|jgi:peptidyl-prolyl cis-trans isomerase D|nr:SurA N-terminal domain-containing protein [Cyclobacteriaceae bacterium]